MSLKVIAVRRVLVGGAEGYLGQKATAYFAKQGCEVLASCRTEPDGARVARMIEAESLKGVTPLVCDLSNDDQVAKLVDDAERRFGPIDGLLNAAGGFRWGHVTELGVADYDFLFSANVRSSWLLSKHLAPRMRSRDFGRMVFVSARATLAPSEAGFGLYTASKAALNAIVQSLAAELKSTGVTVNAIAPSVIDTPANRQAMPDADTSRWVTTDQLMAAVGAFMSPELDAVRGAILPVTGKV